uniref:Hydrophobic seed protein domain-containing protein n=1 Tax=Oryza glumipatula TaxID=40148 RepID=A0A0D9Z4Q6_9ORYZ
MVASMASAAFVLVAIVLPISPFAHAQRPTQPPIVAPTMPPTPPPTQPPSPGPMAPMPTHAADATTTSADAVATAANTATVPRTHAADATTSGTDAVTASANTTAVPRTDAANATTSGADAVTASAKPTTATRPLPTHQNKCTKLSLFDLVLNPSKARQQCCPPLEDLSSSGATDCLCRAFKGPIGVLPPPIRVILGLCGKTVELNLFCH